jgi:hypothetical protein
MGRRVVFAVALAGAVAMLAPSPAPGATFGINAHIPSSAIQNEVGAAGIGWVRIDVVWGLVEIHRDTFDWSRYDTLVDGLAARGLRIFGTLQGTPQWATAGSEFSGVPADPADWREFCYLAASRYRGRVDAWGFWNEPNLDHFWEGTRTQYIDQILLPGIDAVAAADPGALLVAADLAHLSSGDWDDWLARVLADASPLLDVVSHHVYPSNGTAGNVTDKLTEGGSLPWEPPAVREVLDDGGWADRPFWLTETGVESDEYGQSGQASFYENLLGLWFGAARSHDWIDRIFFYEMADPSNDPTLSWGILEAPPGLERKLAFYSYRDFVATAPVDDADLDLIDLPPFAGSLEVLELRCAIRNTGTTTWTAVAGYRLAVEADDPRWQIDVEPLPENAVVEPGDAIELCGSLTAPVAYPFQEPRPVTIEARMEVAGQRGFGTGRRHRLVHTGRQPPHFTRQPAPVTAPINGAAAFTVEVADPSGATFRWRRNTVAIDDDHRHSGATTSVLRIQGIGFDALGDYDCVVTSSAGPLASQPAALTLAGPPIRRPADRVPGELPELIRRWLEFRRAGRAAAAGEARRPADPAAPTWANGG